jgi:hypothetical protein
MKIELTLIKRASLKSSNLTDFDAPGVLSRAIQAVPGHP